MKNKLLLCGVLFLALLLTGCAPSEPRMVIPLDKDWKFTRGDDSLSKGRFYDDKDWETLEVPHDWAIAGPFDMDNDAQVVQVLEEGDKTKMLRSGRTGALPFVGTGWYRKSVYLPKWAKDKRLYIEFDGAMSHAKVYFNGAYIGEQPYGYAPFGFDLTDKMLAGADNVLSVRLENPGESSRWYPGAGLFREVNLVLTEPVHVRKWGIFVTTPVVNEQQAVLEVKTTVDNFSGEKEISVATQIISPDGKTVASATTHIASPTLEREGIEFAQNFQVKDPVLWDLDHPAQYTTLVKVYADGTLTDEYQTVFGIREVRFDADNGFFLNGKPVKIKGVCIHHDLGPLGAAVNRRATERQIEMLQKMGSNAIRTSHNPASRVLIELCDSMGMLVIEEAFDEWKTGKNKNGYGQYFDAWSDKDLSAMIRRDRNSPSVILWSIGNEIREQGRVDGGVVVRRLVEICHREDPTRLTTAGFDNHRAAIANGLASIVDVVGFNYKPQDYRWAKENHPQFILYGSETASTVSSRGVYVYPVEDREKKHPVHDDFQACSYDMESTSWATTPDTEFAAQDDNAFVFGEFVWTGFDYLGEPTPYNKDAPSRSSYFGMVDLAGIPKDRFYLYQSRWSDNPVLHVLPHWTHPGREGQVTPVFCYTNYPKAELFVNGVSQGVLEKDSTNKYRRYRLMWNDVVYQPGDIRVVGYDSLGNAKAEQTVRTAGKPERIELVADREQLKKNVRDLSFITVRILDKDGNLCPEADHEVGFSVEGAGNLRALCNGDATSHVSFASEQMPAFGGMLVATVVASDKSGKIKVNAHSQGLQGAEITLHVD